MPVFALLIEGTTRLPSLWNYLVTFSTFLLVTMLASDPGLLSGEKKKI